jgi:hypothetical protein
MTPEQQAAYVIAMAACAMAEVAGMQAENHQRAHRGESMAYVEQDFTDVCEMFDMMVGKMLRNWRSFACAEHEEKKR